MPIGHELLDAGEARLLHELDAHDRVVVEEAAGVLAVGADAADDGREVDDDVRPRRRARAAVDALARRAGRSPCCAARRCCVRPGRPEPRHDAAAEEAAAAGDHHAPLGPEARHVAPGSAGFVRATKRAGSSPASTRSASSMILDELAESASRRASPGAAPPSTASPHELVHLGRPEVARVDLDVFAASRGRPSRRRSRHELADRVRLAGGDHEVVRLVLLEHQPHRLDVLRRVAPVAPRVEVARGTASPAAGQDGRDAARDLARHERPAAARRLVVEEDAVGGEQAVAPRGTGPSASGRRPWPPRTGCAGGTASSRSAASRRTLPEHLAAAGLVEADRPVGVADGLEQPQRAHADRVGGVLGHLEADLDVALGAEVVDLVGLDAAERCGRATSESVRSP